MLSVVYISATTALESLLLVFMHVAELHHIYIMGMGMQLYIGYRSAIDMFISKLHLIHAAAEFPHTNKQRSELDSPTGLQPLYTYLTR